MVFERLYTPEFLNKNKFIILILSITFTITGIAGSFLFESNHATISLAITSLILYASLKDVFSLNAAQAKKTCSRAALAKEYLSLLSIFFYIFLGVLIVFSLFSILLPGTAASYLFKSQYSLISTTNIQEIYQSGSVQSIFQNNLTVLFVCFVTAFLFGIGAMFLFIVVWNGSVGGVVFGAVAKIAAINAGASPSLVFIILLVSVLPHVIIEMGAYFLAGVAGENTSSFLFFNKKQKKVHQFELSYSCSILIASIILLLLGSIVEKILPNIIFG